MAPRRNRTNGESETESRSIERETELPPEESASRQRGEGATQSAPITEERLITLLREMMDTQPQRSRSKRPRPPSSSDDERYRNTPDRSPSGDGATNARDPEMALKERIQFIQLEKALRPQEPSEYSGGGIAAAKEFIRRCDGVFEMQPHIYYTELERCMYAESQLRGQVSTNWET